MSLFFPVTPSKPSSPPARNRLAPERGSRKPVRPAAEKPESRPKRMQRENEILDVKPRGFLVGDRRRGYYDLDGRYVRVRGREKIVERFGPNRALRALSEEDRRKVENARKRARLRKAPGWED